MPNDEKVNAWQRLSHGWPVHIAELRVRQPIDP